MGVYQVEEQGRDEIRRALPYYRNMVENRQEDNSAAVA